MSYGIDFINETLKYMKEYGVIYGSKKLKDSKVQLRTRRIILSTFFSILVKIFFRFKVKDTQGVKAFKTELFKDFTSKFPDGFLWDLGFVYITKKNDYKWIEIQCNVIDIENSTIINEIGTSIKMFFGLLKFRSLTLKSDF